jgi:hypothetical protein
MGTRRRVGRVTWAWRWLDECATTGAVGCVQGPANAREQSTHEISSRRAMIAVGGANQRRARGSTPSKRIPPVVPSPPCSSRAWVAPFAGKAAAAAVQRRRCTGDGHRHRQRTQDANTPLLRATARETRGGQRGIVAVSSPLCVAALELQPTTPSPRHWQSRALAGGAEAGLTVLSNCTQTTEKFNALEDAKYV